MLESLYSKALKYIDQIDATISVAKKAIQGRQSNGDGDRVWFTFVSEFGFAMNEQKVQDLTFTIPNDADYVAKRLLFLIKMNRANAVAAKDPAGFFHSVQFPFEIAGASLGNMLVDFQVELYESYEQDGKLIQRAFQDLPIPGILTYSRNNPVYGTPSSMLFDLDWEFKRGSVLQAKISILTAQQESSAGANDKDTFRIQGMLEGYKKVRAFK